MQAIVSIWRRRVAPRRALAVVLALAVLFAGMRFVGMLGPASTRWMLPLGFVLMAAAPWMLLSREGRRQIGLRPAVSFSQYLPAVLGGVAAALFRGMLQRSLEERLSVNASTSIECAVFGIVHLCHHGLALGAAGVVIRPLSGALWVVLMFLVAGCSP